MGELNVPIEVRPVEYRQLWDEFIPEAAQTLEDVGHDEVSDLRQTYAEYVDNSYTVREDDSNYLSMPADNWWLIINHLERAEDDGLRPNWLKKKLARRLRRKLEDFE